MIAGAEARAKKLAVTVAGEVGGAYDEASRKASGFGGTLKRIGEVAAGVLLADALQAGAQKAVALIQQTVKAASDLGESVNAVNKTFGAAADRIHAFGRTSAEAVGLSTRAFNELATPLGAMLKNQGLAMDDVADHTIRLTERAADMASVFNTDVSAALVAIQAGLRGEQDPLERFGVSLSAVAVEQRALADTGKTAAKELTSQEKAVARLNLIYDQTASTAGDFADTSDGLANAQRIAAAQIEDAQAKIGATFLPVMAAAATISGDLAQTLGNLPPPVLTATAAIVGLGAATLLAAPRIQATKDALEDMRESSSRAQRGLAMLAGAVGKVTAAMAIFTLAVEVLDQVGWLEKIPVLRDVFSSAEAHIKRLPGPLGKVADAMGEVNAAAEQEAEELDTVVKRFKNLTDAAFAAEEAEDRVADATARLVEQLKEQREAGEKGAGTMDRSTQAGRDNADMVRGLVGDYQDLVHEYHAADKSTDGLAQKLEDQLVSMGFSRAEAKRYADQVRTLADQLNSVPRVVTSTVRVRLDAQETQRELARLYRADGGLVGAAASGGVHGSWTWVGERGRELVKLPYGSMVYPNGQSEAMMSGQMAGFGSRQAPAQVEVAFAGAVDSAFASAFMYLIRTDQIKILSKAVVDG